MSEVASIDKQMHTLECNRAQRDLLELDDTVKATIAKLTVLGQFHNTLSFIIFDQVRGFDVFGSTDTKYLSFKENDHEKRNSIVLYENSGLFQYTVTYASISYNTGILYWDPRQPFAQGIRASSDHRENYRRTQIWSVSSRN